MTEPEALPRGTETLLIVDDQETVWDFLIEALQNLGYSVLLAENGEDAVAIYRDNPSQIDLVLLDMVMPRLGGHDNGAVGFIAKPHRLPKLTRAIRDVLDGKPVTGQI